MSCLFIELFVPTCPYWLGMCEHAWKSDHHRTFFHSRWFYQRFKVTYFIVFPCFLGLAGLDLIIGTQDMFFLLFSSTVQHQRLRQYLSVDIVKYSLPRNGSRPLDMLDVGQPESFWLSEWSVHILTFEHNYSSNTKYYIMATFWQQYNLSPSWLDHTVSGMELALALPLSCQNSSLSDDQFFSKSWNEEFLQHPSYYLIIILIYAGMTVLFLCLILHWCRSPVCF
jgi:hypothetical protein